MSESTSGVENRRTVRVELLNGDVIEGIFHGYMRSALRFETAEGTLDVPFVLIPEDLQRTFPKDPSVVLRAAVERLKARILDISEKLDALPDPVDPARVLETIQSAQETIGTLEAKLMSVTHKAAMLTRENQELRKRLKI